MLQHLHASPVPMYRVFAVCRVRVLVRVAVICFIIVILLTNWPQSASEALLSPCPTVVTER